jgi:anti-anti-sigma factor
MLTATATAVPTHQYGGRPGKFAGGRSRGGSRGEGEEAASDVRSTVGDDYWRYEPRRVQSLPLLLMQKGDPRMVSVENLEALEFIDSSGLAALVHARQHARRAGFDLLLAAPQPQVLRMLTITRLTDVFAVGARVDEAAGLAGRIPLVAAPAAGNAALPTMTSHTPREVLAAGDAA